MRGLYSSKAKIRHQIFTEIARLAYEGDIEKEMDELPYKILPGEVATYRDSIFLERAIVGERLRVAMGLPLRNISEHAPISKGVEASLIEEKYYEPPLINIIKFACNSCPEKRVLVTEGCQGCLEHPCQEVCPKNAIHMENGRSVIDQEKCIKRIVGVKYHYFTNIFRRLFLAYNLLYNRLFLDVYRCLNPNFLAIFGNNLYIGTIFKHICKQIRFS